MNNILYFVLINIAISPFSYARLGETKEQCDERYGNGVLTKPLVENKELNVKIYVYEKNDISIGVTFYKGVAHAITFDKVNNGLFNKLKPEQIENLLKANLGNAKKWEVKEKDYIVSQSMVRDDKSASALWLFTSGQLIIISKEIDELYSAEAKEKHKNQQIQDSTKEF